MSLTRTNRISLNTAKDFFSNLNSQTDLQGFISSSVEGLYLDYKIKRDHSSKEVDRDLQKNISKAISGFANSDGGVLIIGVEDPQNGSAQIKPIIPITEFEQEINSYLPRACSFKVENIQVRAIEIIESGDLTGGVIVLYIPKSDMAPHRSEKDQKYYHRSGESFHPMEHYYLLDVIGRSRSPKLKAYAFLEGNVNTTGKITAIIGIVNEGKVIAKHPYISINKMSGFRINSYGINGNKHFGLPKYPHPTSSNRYKGGVNDVVLPNVDFDVTRIDIDKKFPQQTPGLNEIQLEGDLCCENFPLTKWKISILIETIYEIIKNPREVKKRIKGVNL